MYYKDIQHSPQLLRAQGLQKLGILAYNSQYSGQFGEPIRDEDEANANAGILMSVTAMNNSRLLEEYVRWQRAIQFCSAWLNESLSKGNNRAPPISISHHWKNVDEITAGKISYEIADGNFQACKKELIERGISPEKQLGMIALEIEAREAQYARDLKRK